MASGVEWLGWRAAERGEYPKARDLLTVAASLLRDQGAPGDLARCLERLGDVAQSQRDPASAAQFYEESGDIWLELDDRGAGARTLYKLGRLHLDDGQRDAASGRLKRALLLCVGLGDRALAGDCLAGFAEIARGEGRGMRCARLLAAAALASGRRAGSDGAEPEDLRSRLGAKAFGVAWAEGEGMTLEQAAAYALEL